MMHISDERLAQEFARVAPDDKFCIHAWECGILEEVSPVDGKIRVGVVARFVGHTFLGQIRTYDVLFAEPLAEDVTGKMMTALLTMGEAKHRLEGT